MALSKWYTVLAALWPVGRAWRIDDAENQREFVDAIGAVNDEADGYISALITEAVPATAVALLPEWAELYSLPSTCFDFPETDEELRAQLIKAIPRGQGHNPQDFIDLAAYYGFTITVTTFNVAVAGHAEIGDELNEASTVWLWLITSDLVPGTVAEAGHAQVGDPISQWGEERSLVCLFNKLAHSHRKFLYIHTG